MSRAMVQRQLPADLVGPLRRVQRRVRMVTLAKGSAVVLGAFLVAALVAMAVDFRFIIYSNEIRMAITAGIFLLTLGLCWWFVIRPLLHRFRITALAAAVESVAPDMQERLLSAIELAASRDPDVLRGSAEMIEMVHRQAAQRARSVPLRRVVSFEKASHLWAVVGLLLLLCAATAVLWPDKFFLSAKRLFAANVARVSFTDLAVVPTPADGSDTIYWPSGEPITFKATVRKRPARFCRLVLRGEQGGRQKIDMTRVLVSEDDGHELYSYTMPAVLGRQRYQIRANDAATAWHHLVAVDRPAVLNVSIKVTPPAYSRQSEVHVAELTRPLKVLRHSTLKLTVVTNRPAAEAHLELNRDRQMPLQALGGSNYGIELTATEDVVFRVLLRDEHGFANIEPLMHEIHVVRDEPPSVRIVTPGRQVRLKPSDVLPIRLRAKDDLGVAKAELLYRLGGGKPTALPVALDRAGDRTVEQLTTFDLSAVDIGSARRVRYRIRVADTLPPDLDHGPQTAESAEHEIVIDVKADPYAFQMLKSLRDQFKAALDQIDKKLEAAETQTDPLVRAAEKSQPFDAAADKQTTAVRQLLQDAERLASQTADLTALSDYRKLGEMLRDEIAARHIAPAGQHLARAQMAPEDAARRADEMKRSAFEIGQARKRMHELRRQFDEATLYEQTAQRLADEAARQAALAEKARALGMEPVKAQQAEAPKLSDEQRKMVEALQDIVGKHPELFKPLIEMEKAKQKSLIEQVAEAKAQQDELAKSAENVAQLDASKELAQLAAEQRTIKADTERLNKQRADAMKDAGAEPPKTDPMEHAAKALEAGRPDQAAPRQHAAAEQLDAAAKKTGAEAAKQQAEAARGPAEAQQARQAAKDAEQFAARARQLADRQRQLADATNKAGAQKPATPDAEKAHQRQIDALGKQQRDLSRQVDDLAKDAAAQSPAQKQAADAARRDAQQAAKQLATKAPAAAEPMQRRTAENLAKAAQQAHKHAAAQQKQAAERAKSARQASRQAAAHQQAAAEAGQLRKRQEALARKVDDLARRMADAARPIADEQLRRLATEQQEVARQAADLAHQAAEQPAPGRPAEPNRPAQSAAMQARQAAKGVERMAGKPPAADAPAAEQARGAMKQAAKDLEQAARQLAQPRATGETENWEQRANRDFQRAQQARRAEDLAAEQQRLARKLDDILKREPAKAIASDQRALERQTRELGEAAEFLQQHLEPVNPEMARQAGEVAKALGETAPAQQQRAAEQAEAGQARPAAGHMQQASAAMQQAQARLGRMQQQIAQAANQAAQAAAEAPSQLSPQEAGQLAEQLAEALSAQLEAARAMAEAAQAAAQATTPPQGSPEQGQPGQPQPGQPGMPRPSQDAAAAAAQAAAMLNMTAQEFMSAAMQMAMIEGPPSAMAQIDPMSMEGRGSAGIRLPDAAMLNFDLLGITPSDWARLPGVLRDEVVQAADEKAPAEYRDLIKRYFQQISQAGGNGTTPKKPE